MIVFNIHYAKGIQIKLQEIQSQKFYLAKVPKDLPKYVV